MTIFLLLHRPHETQIITGGAQQREEEEARSSEPGSSCSPTPVALSQPHNLVGEGVLLASSASRPRVLLSTVQRGAEPAAKASCPKWKQSCQSPSYKDACKSLHPGCPAPLFPPDQAGWWCYRLVTKSHLTLCHPMDCSPPGSSVRGISQARILEWVAISFSRGSSRSRDRTHISCSGKLVLYH